MHSAVFWSSTTSELAELKLPIPLFAVIVQPETGVVPETYTAISPSPVNRFADTWVLETSLMDIPLVLPPLR